MELKAAHHSGFVNIIGRPNVGKSTLMNALVGERMSIITNKPQTTRHRIIGIVSEENYQIVFSDTPGFVQESSYKMHDRMNNFVYGSFEDADVLLFVVDTEDKYDEENPLFAKLERATCSVFLVLNKIDLLQVEKVQELIQYWQTHIPFEACFPIAALHKTNTEQLFDAIQSKLPIGPVYFPKNQLTDRPERFFVSEIIREKILLNYYQEIPYSCEIVVDGFQEDEEKDLIRIHATIYVIRKTQKYILIGKGGSALKQVGIEARKDIEKFVEKKVYLELYVKVRDNWRDDDRQLQMFGY